jgi:hypothetical protein
VAVRLPGRGADGRQRGADAVPLRARRLEGEVLDAQAGQRAAHALSGVLGLALGGVLGGLLVLPVDVRGK